MHHVAIMKKSCGLIPKILSGEKKIEPFYIDKIGFGPMSAWLVVENVKKIRLELADGV